MAALHGASVAEVAGRPRPVTADPPPVVLLRPLGGRAVGGSPYARGMRPVTDLERRVAPFDVQSDYQPAGDQPAAIEEISRRIQGGVKDVVLLGATGTGKTATVAWVAEQVQRPMLVLQPNKTLAAQFANELRQLFPHNAVEYFVSYYDYYQPSGDQPAAIAEITKRINAGVQDVVLLGATGTGKTATVAWVAEQVQRPMQIGRAHV